MNMKSLSRFAVYVAISVAWAITGYMNEISKKEHVTFDPTKFGTTVLIGVIAGVIMAARGDEPTPGAFEAATAVAIPISDRIVNRVLDARRDNAEPTSPTNDAEPTEPTSASETTDPTDESETTDPTDDSETTKYR